MFVRASGVLAGRCVSGYCSSAAASAVEGGAGSSTTRAPYPNYKVTLHSVNAPRSKLDADQLPLKDRVETSYLLGETATAVRLLRDAIADGQETVPSTLYGRIMSTYVAQKLNDCAVDVFDILKKTNTPPDVATYTVALQALANINAVRSIEVLSEMSSRGLRPDAATMGDVLRGLCDAKEFEKAKQAASMTEALGFPDTNQVKHLFIRGLYRSTAPKEDLASVLNALIRPEVTPQPKVDEPGHVEASPQA
jgi:hypothetical protein